MLIAEAYMGRVGVGITTPRFFRANDGNIYVVKLQNNRLGPTVLACEILAAQIGKQIGLCFPESGIIEIREEWLAKRPDLIEAGITPGRHFASRYLENVEYLGKDNLDKAVNMSDMAGVVLFDHMFHNADRSNNKKNLLLRREDGGFRVYAIDNSHLFRTGRWTVKTLEKLCRSKKVYYPKAFGLMLREKLHMADFIPFLDKVKQLSDEEIDNIVKAIPEEWLPDDQRQALPGFVKTRRDLAEEIWKHLCKHIPKAHGGSRREHSRVIVLTQKGKEKGGHLARRKRLSLGKSRKGKPSKVEG